MSNWTTSDIPPLHGKSAVITGTGGLGYETALALADAGASIIIAGRNADKGATAVERIVNAAPGASVRFEHLDLASLASVKSFCTRLATQTDSLDLLINNAGVMVPPQRQETVDGFELQMATNYLGHFALTAQLMPLLQKGNKPRVVTVSSIAARNGIIDFDDLNAKKRYVPMEIYSQSKLACLMFALELHRRSKTSRWGVTSIAAHPGVSRTDLLHNAPGRQSLIGITRSLLWFLFQPAAQGALPTLYAATSPLARGGAYYGPDKLSETRGLPTEAKIPPQAKNSQDAARLWSESEKLTATTFASLDPAEAS